MVLKNPEASRRVSGIKVLFSKRSLPKWRVFSLVFVHLLFAVHFLHWKMSGRTLAPFEFSESLYTLHSGILTLGFIFMAATIAGTLCFGRFFCGWGCHILALQDSSAWILSKFGIKPKPIRSRVLLWVPFATFAFMFLWPQAVRIFTNQPRPPFVILSETQGWSSFVTTDLMRAMPGLGFTLITFAVCGFLIVYFLGSRSFCYSVCPYGVFFGWTDRFAPGAKVVLAGDCEGCGLCTQNCKSGVNVIQEIKRYGAVVDKNCLKSLDCVSGCPKQALGLGFTMPSFWLEKAKPNTDANPKSKPKPKPKPKPKHIRKYDFKASEEILFTAVFIPMVATYYGLYSQVGILLGVAISVIGGFCAISLKRMIAARRALSGSAANVSGKPPVSRRRYRMVLAASVLFAAFTLHSAFVHFHTFMGGRLFDRHFRPVPSGEVAGQIEAGQIEAGQSGGDLSRSVAHLRAAHAWGWIKPDHLEWRLALAYDRLGNRPDAERFFRGYLSDNGNDSHVRVQYGNLLAQTSRPDSALTQYLAAILPDALVGTPEARVLRATAHSLAARGFAGKGDTARAIAHLKSSVADNPDDISNYCNFSMLSIKIGRLDEASSMLSAGRERFGLTDCLLGLSRMGGDGGGPF